MEWYISSLLRKLAVVQQLPGEFGCISGYSGPGARTFRAETRTLRVQQQAHSKLFLVIFLSGFCGSLGLYEFLEHQTQVTPGRSKSLLIVRCSYTSIQNKILILELTSNTNFHFRFRGRASSLDSLTQPQHLHTCLITTLNVHVFCCQTPKPTQGPRYLSNRLYIKRLVQVSKKT